MGINITQTLNNFQFENRENMRNTARDILSKQNGSHEKIQNILDKTIFDYGDRAYSNSQLAIIKASSQISMNGNLKETLKYLKNHSTSKRVEKAPVLGELWDLFNKEEMSYNEEYDDIEIDYSLKNIFEAA